jgi:SHS2 domain-containing protein
MYETFDHTADLGMRVRSPSLTGLFEEAGAALLSLIVEDPKTIHPQESVRVRFEEDDLAYLLSDWLRELLYLFDARHFLACEFQAEVGNGKLAAVVRGETMDPARHVLAHEVKAVTSHGLKVCKVADGYEAEFIVDI